MQRLTPSDLYSSPPPIDVLYEMRQTKPELFSQVEVWIDGGVRRGTDVVKGWSSSRARAKPSIG